MLRLSAYILLSVTLFNSNFVLQLSKLPKLFEHYCEHNRRNPELSFVDFLSMHYWGKDANDKDEAKDRQLPFKGKVANSIHGDVMFTLPLMDLKSPVGYQCALRSAHYVEAVTTMDIASLFRPPQEI
ncbi:hypothetical protein [Parapedobacter sp.]